MAEVTYVVLIEPPVQYCTHPAERESQPGDSQPLPEADTCRHVECRPTGPVTDLTA